MPLPALVLALPEDVRALVATSSSTIWQATRSFLTQHPDYQALLAQGWMESSHFVVLDHHSEGFKHKWGTMHTHPQRAFNVGFHRPQQRPAKLLVPVALFTTGAMFGHVFVQRVRWL